MKTTRHPTRSTVSEAPRRIVRAGLVIAALVNWTASANTRYVWQDSPNPAAPYTDWTTAAHVIQDAVDVAADGDTVLVADGVYSTGGRAVFGTMTNRVAIDKAITVESLMGPEVTVIEGAPASGSGDGNGDGAIRCVYLVTNAVLSGFTLTSGHTRTNGEYFREQSGGGALCERSALLTNCVLIGNSAGDRGGGAARGTLRNCALTSNSAAYGGGGTSAGTLYNCTLTGNLAAWGGGGSYYDTLYNCTLAGNSASTGGGCRESILYNCSLTGNSASSFGGGTYGGTLYNCTVRDNSAQTGGGTAGGSLFNCIVYFNTASSGLNYTGIGVWGPGLLVVDPSFHASCTTPLPSQGTNNIDADPQMATLTHLSASSPCIGAGSIDYATGVDIDGEPWPDPPCIGADQLTPGRATGPLTMAIKAEYTSVAPGFAVRFSADNQGAILASVWDFDDGTVVTNQPVISHAWSASGNYTVRLTGYNDRSPEGATATVQVEVPDTVYFVNRDNLTPTWPYDSWEKAATNIQDAIEARSTAGRLVLVTNGVYASGNVVAQGTNRIALTDHVQVRSVNGPELTVIEGAEGVRCAYGGNRAVLSGFTLTKGRTDNGGGAWCESSAILTNCVITGNSADSGGGVLGGTLYNCALTGNSAKHGGGGTSGGTLYNCTLTRNSASWGGGSEGGVLYNCTLTGNSAELYGGGSSGNTHYNCIVYFNTAPANPNYSGGTFNFACTTPLPFGGTNNIVADPQMASLTHLSALSPCIGAGSSDYASGVDVDGEPGLAPPCTGADQLTPGRAAGPLTMAIEADYANVPPGYGVRFLADNQGPILTSVWDFGDGTLTTNQPIVSHAWSEPGHYTVRLAGYNDSFPDGVTATVRVEVTDEAHYVNQANPTPLFPYTTWQTAATSIQEAIEANITVGGLVLVTNGVYASGSVEVAGANRIALTYPVQVRSVNGPEVTVIEGGEGVRCAYVGNHATLSGFTLTKGQADYGGGVWCEAVASVINCMIADNSASEDGGGAWCESAAILTNCVITGNSADKGGGVLGGTLYNCTLTGNSAKSSGGGASAATLSNCTLTHNSAFYGGGGASGGTLYNCILTSNSVNGYYGVGGGARGGTLWNCTLTGNAASGELSYGGGAYGGTLYNCILMGNWADFAGGGFADGTLYNCTVTGNSASFGGGADGKIYAHPAGSSDSGDEEISCLLSNCTLTGNSATDVGGGSYHCTLYNCILANNRAKGGGGSVASTLYNCTLAENSAAWGGGGSYYDTLYNCTLAGNSASTGGGCRESTLYNCIVYFNIAPIDPDHSDSIFNSSCTAPLPTNGVGNITNAPLFVNTNGWSDLHLRYGSPGIDAGTNLSAIFTTDFDGNPRPLDGDGDGIAAFDMGAYEFDARSVVPSDWFTSHGLDPADPQVVSSNPDNDPFTTFQEWLADTDPTNASSCFQIQSITLSPPTRVSFLSSSNRTYSLWRANRPHPTDWTVIQDQAAIPGTGGILTLSDEEENPIQFYEVQVNLP